MSNGEVCCILGVCCPPGSSAQREHLIEMIQKQRPHLDAKQAAKKADKVLAKFDNFKGLAEVLDEGAAQA